MKRLYPHQKEWVQKIAHCFTAPGDEHFTKVLGVAPTGSGKTVLVAKLIQGAIERKDRKVLFLADTDELIWQGVEEIREATGMIADVDKAERHAQLDSPLVVGSIQSLQRRLEKYPKEHFGLCVYDEAHKSLAAGPQKVLNYFHEGGSWILGVTATPMRGDRKDLMSWWETIGAEIDLWWLVDNGYLSPINIQTIPISIDINEVKSKGGDLDPDELDKAMESYLEEIVVAMKEACQGRKTLIFHPLIKTSQKFTEIALDHGIAAAHIDGNSPDRRELLQGYRDDRIMWLSNSALLTTGFNEPGISCVVILRPTKSTVLYRQMIGRGTRVFPGKGDLLVLDFLWAAERHNLAGPACMAGNVHDEVLRLATAKARAAGTPMDLQGIISEAAMEREEAMLKQIARNKAKSGKFFDARHAAAVLGAHALFDYEPAAKWEKKAATQRQLEALVKFGVDAESVTGMGHASAMLEVLVGRAKQGLCTLKQLRLLNRQGVPKAESMSFEDASQFIDRMMRR